jgi:hypothetical protein
MELSCFKSGTIFYEAVRDRDQGRLQDGGRLKQSGESHELGVGMQLTIY